MRKILLYGTMLLLSFFIVGTNLFAQKEEETEGEKAERLRLQQEVLRYQEMEKKLLEQAFEQAIDPESYIVGPGDYFSVVIWGDIQKGFQLPITPEGVLIIPTIGKMKVDDLTLKQTKEAVLKAARRKYRKTNISTNLMSMRKIRVHVTGEVFNQGTYIATPIDRVSDLISRANGLTDYAYVQEIKIKHLNGEETTVDFSAFQQNGQLDQNPFVKGGDIIVVPPIDFSNPVVKVEGMVSKPGFYPIKQGERIGHFLTRHNLLTLNQNLTKITVERDNGISLSVNLTDSSSHTTTLQNGDKILLEQDIQSSLLNQVYVTGAVRNPGRYTYIKNYKVKDYVGRAGVMETAGSLNRIQVFHIESGDSEKGKDATVYPGDVIEVPIRMSTKVSDYLQIASQLATLLIAYFAIQR